MRAGPFVTLALACGFAWALGGCGAEASRGGAVGVSAAAKVPAARPEVPALRVVWPVPGEAFERGAGLEEFIQPAASGRVESGLYGSTREGGRRFHEGLDLRPSARDGRGEPTDSIFAAMGGVVRHASARAGASSYGCYVVLEHPEVSPPVYTLYAHLASIAPEIRPGRRVTAGETLGRMGRTAAGYTIPRERAHLHFEIGLRLADNFDAWYRRRGFGNPNEHGKWNGYNLLGADPLAFFRAARGGGLRSLDTFFGGMTEAVAVRVAGGIEPEFVRRHPSLVAPGPAVGGGWEISFDAVGLPFRWRRLPAAEFIGWRTGEERIVRVNDQALSGQPARHLVARGKRGAPPRPGEDLQTTLDLVLGDVGMSVRL